MVLDIVVGSKLPKTLYFSKPMTCKKAKKYPGNTFADTVSLQMKYVFMFFFAPPKYSISPHFTVFKRNNCFYSGTS